MEKRIELEKRGRNPGEVSWTPLYFIVLLCSTRDRYRGLLRAWCSIVHRSESGCRERIVFPRATPTPRTRSAARHWLLEDARELGFLDGDRVAPTIYRARRRVLDADTRCYDYHKSNRHGVVRLNGLSPSFFITSSLDMTRFLLLLPSLRPDILFRVCTLLSRVSFYQIPGKFEETDTVRKDSELPVVVSYMLENWETRKLIGSLNSTNSWSTNRLSNFLKFF